MNPTEVLVGLADSDLTQIVQPSTSSDLVVTGGDTMASTSEEKPSEVDVKHDPADLSWEPSSCSNDDSNHSEIAIKKEKGEKPYSCDVCGCRASKPSDLRKHMRTHTGEKPYSCDVCGYRASQTSHLKKHMRTHTGEQPYACDVCGYKTTEAPALKRHMTTHTGEQPYACDVCGYRASQTSHLKAHMRIHTGEKPYACDVCGCRVSKASDLKKHKRTHTGEKPYACDVCGYRASQTSHLKKHMRSHTGEKPYACHMCGYRGSDVYALQEHIRTHTGEQPYACDVCGYRASRTSHLKSHMRTHTGEKPYVCDVCEYSATVASDLKKHMRSHTGEKPYACDVCGYRASQTCHLKKHMRTHTGEKPYACDVCEYRATVAFSLKQHMRTHTGEKPYSCDVCGYRASQSFALKSHMRIHTGITILSSVFLVALVGTGVMWFTDIYVEEIINQMTIREGSDVYEAWKKPPMKPMICIYIFNYTNMLEYTAKIDDKIKLKEVGPYCYRETLEKKNVTFNPDGTVTYGDIRKHEFDPLESKGSPNDTLVVPNLALIATLGMTKNLSFLMKVSLSLFLKNIMHYSASTVKVTASNFILGYDDKLIKLGLKLAKLIGQDVPFDKFGLLTSRSAITEETTTVRTGTNDVDRIGIVTEINGQTKLYAWDAEECNRIDGSDGAFFPRRTINESATLYLFHKDMCRKMPFVYDKEVNFQEDVMAMRFVPAPSMFNTKGTCFCLNNTECAPNGVFDTSPCHEGVPIFMSYPHFLKGDPVLSETFEGLHPDPEKHDFYIDIQRLLGFTLGTISRIQLNIQVQKSKGYDSFFREFPNNLILPVAWLQVSAGKMPPSLYRVIYHATFTVRRMQIALRWGLLIITTVTFYFLIRYIRRKPVKPNSDSLKENRLASQEMLASGPSTAADIYNKL